MRIRRSSFADWSCFGDGHASAAGISGHKALGEYLTGLFGAMPPTTYTPEEIWPTHNGYCGRWYAEIGAGAEQGRM